MKRYKGQKFLERFWLDNYADGHCTICGNFGIIDSRGVKTPAGVNVGRLNYCICPNGQSLRIQKADLDRWLKKAL